MNVRREQLRDLGRREATILLRCLQELIQDPLTGADRVILTDAKYVREAASTAFA